jgi:hydroxymethylpyrimidine pyrophosphatase-like HAD family hydrolase
VKELDKLELDYMFHAPVPDNHFCLYSIKSNSSDLNKRLGLYKDFSKPWTCSKETLRCWKNKGSILVISCEKEQSESVYIKLCCDFPKLKIIRCTSPISADYCWIEVIPTSTSKAEAAKWLKAFLNFNGETMGIGNDFNDLDLLQWTDKSYVVGNAPESMRNDFNVVCENNSDGFSDAVSDFLIGKDRS